MGQSVLTEKQVREIKKEQVKGLFGTNTRLAEKYGVSLGAISQISTGANWGHIKVRGWKPQSSMLSDEDVLAIRKALKEGAVGRRLAKQYGVSTGTISLIKNNKIHKE